MCVLKEDGGGLRDLTLHCHWIETTKMEDNGGACHGRLIRSGNKRVYQPGYLHTEAYAALTTERSSVQMAFVENHIRL